MELTVKSKLVGRLGYIGSLIYGLEKDGKDYPVIITRHLPSPNEGISKGWYDCHPDWNSEMDDVFTESFGDSLVFADTREELFEKLEKVTAKWDVRH